MKRNGIRTTAMALWMVAAGLFFAGDVLARNGIPTTAEGNAAAAEAVANEGRTAQNGLFGNRLGIRSALQTAIGALASGLPVVVEPGEWNEEFCAKDWGAPINALAAETFGTTEAEVVAQLHRGAVLLELAETPAQEWEFIFNMVDRINARIDEAVDTGIITEEQAELLRRAAPALAAYVSENGGGPYWGSGPAAGKFWGVWRFDVADYLTMPLEDLSGELASGVTLGELTESLGKDVDGLVDILAKKFNEILDQLVEDGVIQPERADFLRMVADQLVLRMIYETPPCFNR